MNAESTLSALEPGPDDWIHEVRGTHRCLFDFPQHRNAMPLLHILNYLNTYATAYQTTPGQVGAVGTFYSAGNLIPGVTIVPAMVITIDKAQEAGITYNRQ